MSSWDDVGVRLSPDPLMTRLLESQSCSPSFHSTLRPLLLLSSSSPLSPLLSFPLLTFLLSSLLSSLPLLSHLLPPPPLPLLSSPLFPLSTSPSSPALLSLDGGLNGHLGQTKPSGCSHRCEESRVCVSLNPRRSPWEKLNFKLCELKWDFDDRRLFPLVMFVFSVQLLLSVCLHLRRCCKASVWLSCRSSEAGERSQNLQIAQTRQHWWDSAF